MALNIKNGLVQINETSEDKIINFHLKRGFAMLTAFRSEYSLAQNRNRNRQLASHLKSLGYGFIKVTGGYTENIGPDNPNWDDAESTQDPDIRRLPIMEESFLVPMYDINAHDIITDFNTFKSDMIDLGKEFEQDSVLVAPPIGQGSPAYIITNSRSGEVGSIDCTFNNLTVAGVTSQYFSMKEKTLNKARAKRREGVGGVRFESAWLDEPAYTISGVRIRAERNELPPFGSHYYGNSQVGNLTTLERRVEKLEQFVRNKFAKR